MIYTSYYGNYRKFPENYIPISIAKIMPRGANMLQFITLAPSQEILLEYKQNNNWEDYQIKFKQVLSKLNPEDIYTQLCEIAKTQNIILLCYEKKGDNCHRHLVAEWFRNAGIECEEL